MYKDKTAVYWANSEVGKPLCVGNGVGSFTIFFNDMGDPTGYFYHEFENDRIVRTKTIVSGHIPAEYLQEEERSRI